MARIFVVGAGVVGAAVGRAFSEAGHALTFVDVSPDRVEALDAEGFDAHTRLDLRGEPSSYVFLTLPTPAGPQGYDLRAIAGGARDVGRAIGEASADRRLGGRHSTRREGRGDLTADGYPVHIVVTRSTVPPGTTTQLVGPAVAQASGTTEGAGFALAANPEFLRAASADDDARWPWMTVVGARSRRVAERMRALLEPFGGDLRVFDRPETAELVKCAHNLYNATKISFWNEMWLVAGKLGLDPDEVAGTVARSAEASMNPRYGIRGGAPFEGRCLPKDTSGFLAFARELGLPMHLLDAVVDVNRQLGEQVDGEVAALTRSGSLDVVDLREAERRDSAVPASAVQAYAPAPPPVLTPVPQSPAAYLADARRAEPYASQPFGAEAHSAGRYGAESYASGRPDLEPTPLEPTPLDFTAPASASLEPTPLEPTPLEPTSLEPTPLEPTPLEPSSFGRTAGRRLDGEEYGAGQRYGAEPYGRW